MKGRPCVLAIGGWDPTSGAGIVADAKAIHANGAYALTALTALAVQTADRIVKVEPVSRRIVSRSLASLGDACAISAVKTGMLSKHGRTVLGWIRRFEGPWVCDPVQRASDGTSLGRFHLHWAFPRNGYSLLTPNILEFERLTGCSADDPKPGLARLFRIGFDAVLLKGGHATGRWVHDVLYTKDGWSQVYERKRSSVDLHGSGCTLAAAIAAQLARGVRESTAILAAEKFMDRVFEEAMPMGMRSVSVLP